MCIIARIAQDDCAQNPCRCGICAQQGAAVDPILSRQGPEPRSITLSDPDLVNPDRADLVFGV